MLNAQISNLQKYNGLIKKSPLKKYIRQSVYQTRRPAFMLIGRLFM